MNKKRANRLARLITSAILLTLCATTVQAQKSILQGRVYETVPNGKKVPLEFATIAFPDYGIGTMTDEEGRYTLPDIPAGKAKLTIQYVGKQTIDTLILVNKNLTLVRKIYTRNHIHKGGFSASIFT